MLDWITSTAGYWTVAIALLLAGLMVIVHGWIGDRWRYGTKTPRCRRCRYDMSGMKPDDPLRKCSECGYEHRKVSQLHQPRKGWKKIALGGLVVWAAMYLLLSPDVRLRMEKAGDPWHIAAIPDTVRIAVWPWLSNERRQYFGQEWAASSIYYDDIRPPLVPLHGWQARWYVGQLERDARSANAGRRLIAIGLAAMARRQYDSIEERAGDILRAGLNDADVEVRLRAFLVIEVDRIELKEPDFLRVLETALHEPALLSGGSIHDAVRHHAINILTHLADRIPESQVDQLWESLNRVASESWYTVSVVPCLWALNPAKAAPVTFQLLRDKDSHVSHLTVLVLPVNIETWNLIADYFKVCPVEVEERVVAALQYRDDARCRELLTQMQASPDPQLKAKAERAIQHLKD